MVLGEGEETAGPQEGAVMNIWFSFINGTRGVKVEGGRDLHVDIQP